MASSIYTPRIELDEPEPVVAEVEVEAELVAEAQPEPVVAEVEVSLKP